MKKLIILALALSLMILLAACGGDDSGESEGSGSENTEAQPSAQEPIEFTDEEKVAEDESVADVNGTEIKGNEYNALYPQVKMSLQQGGQASDDQDQVKELTVNMLVEQELINQAAEEQGVEVTDEEVQSEYDMMEEQAGDQLASVLDQFHLTEEAFKNQLNDNLLTTKYMESEFDIEVTDEEVEEYYNQLTEQSDEVGELEEVEDQIREQLNLTKTQEQLQTELEELREQAEVEMLI
ncbi:SurA N-terminal domain-containing protein [Virgibacillus sp. NKC19-16]|uniref:SurA N-terminal domain-containing protein n=1 Tax=Virgibacillus salidurans TaxID=2831673 RepID=UPI001F287896|nr:SurA N-terminal domain-containing protein [Virgibacillus sp. NKC19-16]UJL46920.1 SurA N-terminal domain-containing protein [Virgibacillus sp. NKC19-16]